jgi:hypothetical protein
MKTIEDIRLEMKISDMILELIDDGFEDMPRGDIQGVVEALAMRIIQTVKAQ